MSDEKAVKTSVPRSKVPLPALEISEPYVHRNLAVYFLSAEREPDEHPGYNVIRDGDVLVRERAAASVQQLQIQNSAGAPLFLHEGERLQGGRQDRTVRTSMVVPAQSGVRDLPAFCIEQRRWGGGERFRESKAEALAPREVRLAAKVEGDQGQVWSRVARAKSAAQERLAAGNKNSSLNELFDSPQVQKAVAHYLDALQDALGSHAEASGVAFAIDGELLEVDLYATPELLRKVYPQLLGCYALEALLVGGGFADAPQTVEVLSFWKRGRARSRRTTRIDSVNDLTVASYATKVECLTAYEGRVVHHQMLRR